MGMVVPKRKQGLMQMYIHICMRVFVKCQKEVSMETSLDPPLSGEKRCWRKIDCV